MVVTSSGCSRKGGVWPRPLSPHFFRRPVYLRWLVPKSRNSSFAHPAAQGDVMINHRIWCASIAEWKSRELTFTSIQKFDFHCSQMQSEAVELCEEAKLVTCARARNLLRWFSL